MSNMVSDMSLWVFVACAVGFLAAIGLTIKSYRDAKYASYFFLREEAALRVKRLLFVLIPLAIVIVFLGLRLFGPDGINPILPAGPSGGSPNGSVVASTGQTPKPTASAAGATKAATVKPAASPALTVTAATVVSETGTMEPGPANTNASTPATVEPATAPTSTTTSSAPTMTVAATITVTVPHGPGGTPPFAATVDATQTPASVPVSATVSVSATASLTAVASPTSTDTPVVGKATPRDDAVLGSIILSRGIGPNKTPLQPSSTFSTSDSYIYVFYEFHNMTNGVVWSHRWFHGGTEVGSSSSLWNWGSDGRGYLFFSPTAGPGQYEIRLYIGERVTASAAFRVQ